MGERGGWTNRVTTGHTGGLTHYQSNHLSVALICSTVRCILGRSVSFPGAGARGVRCTDKFISNTTSIPVMGSLASKTRTLQAVGTFGGTILGAQCRTGLPGRNCVLFIRTT